jgi:putative ABC transport system permease protein
MADGVLKPARRAGAILAYAASLAVLLCAVGLYGTLAFSVARRTKEMGIRMAVGATPRAAVAMVLREGMAVALAGVLVGMVIAAGATKLVGHLLFGAASADGLFFAAGGLTVAGVSLLAAWVPARRAARVDPLLALRED